jgi:hypothetical protein
MKILWGEISAKASKGDICKPTAGDSKLTGIRMIMNVIVVNFSSYTNLILK